MSLPLSRRIAQAALLVAAGATPLVAAGAASADQLAKPGTDLGAGVSKLDGVTSTSTVTGEAHSATRALGTTGSVLTGMVLPMATGAAGTAANGLLADPTSSLGGPAELVADHTKQGTSQGSGQGDTTAATGELTDAVGKFAPAAQGPLHAASANRSMPMSAPGLSGAPGMPGVSGKPVVGAPKIDTGAKVSEALDKATGGLDRMLNGELLSDNPVDGVRQLTTRVPATHGLGTQIPDTGKVSAAAEELTGSLSGREQLTDSLPPAVEHTLGAVPATEKYREITRLPGLVLPGQVARAPR
ncbi:hypothetical protein [Kitasatospora sp. LaBMicrA B282]|uniref:hypothetical protein n=1 Tax=Kitasatospora sp. LaBMicrA B282 TaxID=3420949 RepID=UPI003D148098